MNKAKKLAENINWINSQYMVKRTLVETEKNGGIVFRIQVPVLFKLLFGKSYAEYIKDKIGLDYTVILISTIF